MDPEKGTLTRDNVKLADMAMAWKPGTVLSDNVLSGKAPIIKGSTKLYTPQEEDNRQIQWTLSTPKSLGTKNRASRLRD